ncbi:MAG: hypothetical protein LBQ96_00255 [Fusobacteriaceae bacterium]|nr:hypothetical protein [Fusobacteriaceae bacterium]
MTLAATAQPATSRPETPQFLFAAPDTPDVQELKEPEVLLIKIGDIDVKKPAVVKPEPAKIDEIKAPGFAGISVKEPDLKLASFEVEVNPAAPEFEVKASLPVVKGKVIAPTTVADPNPQVPDLNPVVVQPNVSPFTDYAYWYVRTSSNGGYPFTYLADGSAGGKTALLMNYHFTGGTYYTGVAKSTAEGGAVVKANEAGGFGMSGTSDAFYGQNGVSWTAFPTTSLAINGRTSTILYFHNLLLYPNSPKQVENVTLHVAGNDGSYTDTNGLSYLGSIGMHTAGHLNVTGVTGYLYGRAIFVSNETWQAGDVKLANSQVHVSGSDNTVFYISPANYTDIQTRAARYQGSYTGAMDVVIPSKGNAVYLQAGLSGSIKIENSGLIRLEGASNTVYTTLGYSPNYTKFTAHGVTYEENMTPSIQLTTPVELYGDENVLMFFNSKWTGKLPWIYNGSGDDKPFIGIYQGQIKVAAHIGDGPQTNITASEQTAEGRITEKENSTYNYTAGTVDGSVGIYSRSGQRTGISAQLHLGAGSTYSYYDGDAIHGLEIGNVDIKFGRNSKGGFMFISDLGTVIEVAKPGTDTSEIGSLSTAIFDGIDKIVDNKITEGEAATGTIIAYSKGKWDQSVHKLGTSGVLDATDSSLTNLVDKPSEINIYIPVTMTSMEGIGFFADSYGHVNVVGSTSNVTATGYRAIVAYAKNYGVVTIDGNITAQDAHMTTNVYQNIGAYAAANGTITIKGAATVDGIGALAKGTGAHVIMTNGGNQIFTGVDRGGSYKSNGGLVALNGGIIEFAGVITHKKLTEYASKGNTHADTLPFYADSASKIVFRGDTTINLSDGAVFYGKENEYTSEDTLATRYSGMKYVTVNITDNDLSLGVFNGITVDWSGADITAVETKYLKQLADTVKIKEIKNNSHWYKSYLEGGVFNIGFNVNLDTVSLNATKGADPFNDIVLEREKVAIANGVTVSSAQGNGLALASNINANAGAGKNQDSGFTNAGTISVTGGNQSAVYVNYGYVKNSGLISADKGIGAMGVNGSQLVNTGTIKVEGKDAAKGAGPIGMAGLARKVKADGSADAADAFGTDVTTGADQDNTTALVDIENNGTIRLGSDTKLSDYAVGIYAANNVAGARARVKVVNNRLIELGNDSVGVLVSGATEGGTITLSTNDAQNIGLKLGKNGIGVYAENSDITVNGASYTIALEDNGIGVLARLDSTIKGGAGAKLILDYKGTVDGTATAVVLQGEAGKTATNNLAIEVKAPADMKKTVSALYSSGGGGLVNTGALTSAAAKAYGIIADCVDVSNSGVITTGNPTGDGGIGIYVRNADLTTGGDKLQVKGTGAIGVFARSEAPKQTEAALAAAKTVTLSDNTTLAVTENKGIGVYILDSLGDKMKLNLKSDVNLTAASADTNRKIGAFLQGAKNTGNLADGVITLAGTDTGGYNIGVYAKDSYLNTNGTYHISGLSNIGVFAESTGTGTTLVTGGVAVNVAGSTTKAGDISIGVYGKGSKVAIQAATAATYTVGPNGVGVFMDGDASSKLSGTYVIHLSSKGVSETEGIGIYYKGGASGQGTVTLDSTLTESKDGLPVRPIGIYFGEGSTVQPQDITIAAGSQSLIGLYGKDLSAFNATGKLQLSAESIGGYFTGSNVNVNGNTTLGATAENAYGWYFKDGNSTIGAATVSTILGKNGIAYAIEGAGGKLTNKGTIQASVAGSIGAFATEGGLFTNDVGAQINATAVNGADPGSLGLFAKGGKIENKGQVNSFYVGIYGQSAADILLSAGEVTAAQGIGILAKDKGTAIRLTGGDIKGTSAGTVGVYALDNAEATLAGSKLTIADKGIGLYATGGAALTLKNGDITVGAEGAALYGKESVLDLSAYTGTITLGNKGIAVYAAESAVTGGSAVKVSYSSAGGDKGVGVYYEGANPTTNSLSFTHSGDNLVSVYADGVKLTNTANQTIQNLGIGIYADNGATLANTGTLNLLGTDTVGIYLDKTKAATAGVTTLTDVGTITGAALNVAGKSKVGVYVKDGDIIGTNDYNFAISGGVGLYLAEKLVSWQGTLKVGASSTANNKTIGMYVAPKLSGTLAANIEITAPDAVGMYLDSDGADKATINYTGSLKILNKAPNIESRSIGVVLDEGTQFTLTGSGSLELGDAENVGFYVRKGAHFTVASGAKITNLEGGIVAYIEDGQMDLSGLPTVNYANMIAAGTSGLLTNASKLTVGTKGLQANTGATIVNDTAGNLVSSVENGKALAATSGATIVNRGKINLTGENSVAIFVDDGATATTTGAVSVGENSVAYYAASDGAGSRGVITVAGITTVGKGSTLLYAKGGEIHYKAGNISLGDAGNILTIEDAGSVVTFLNSALTVGAKGTGIYVKGTGDINDVSGVTGITVGAGGAGVYISRGNNWTTGLGFTLAGEKASALVMAGAGNIQYGGILSSTAKEAKGIVLTAGGNLTNTGTVSLTGEGSLGLYGENLTSLVNDTGALVALGAGTDTAAAIALYGKNAHDIVNRGEISLVSNAVGIYGEKAAVRNDGAIHNAGHDNTGVYAVGGSVVNTGAITLGDTSNGIYLENGTKIENSGNITVGGAGSSGLYGTGTTTVLHKAGTVTVGAESTGVATEAGAITIAKGAKITAGEQSTYIYTEKGAATLEEDLTLSDYSIGMYTTAGTLTNKARITTGLSGDSSSDGKTSVAMAAGPGAGKRALVNAGVIDVAKKGGVGMLVSNKDSTALNTGTIYVAGTDAYGVVASDNAAITNQGDIYVTGSGARGMAATGGARVLNDTSGRVYVQGDNNTGVFVTDKAVVSNKGEIFADGNTNTGIFIGRGGVLENAGKITVMNGGLDVATTGANETVHVGEITVESQGPTITVGSTVYDMPTIVNSGYIEFVNGALDFGTVAITSADENIGTISAENFLKGEFIVLPGATQGNNDPVRVIQYLKGLGSMPQSGSVKVISQSVTWLPDLQADPDNPDVTRIVLVKIPYAFITENTPAYEFGKGLDEIYANAQGPELAMFDNIDMISDKDELAAVFDMELRGNVYANIQQRMLDVKDVLTDARENLRENELYSMETLKIGAIAAGGNTKDANAGVEDYEYKTAGVTALKEYALRSPDTKAWWGMAFGVTDLDFDFGSKEKIYSLEGSAGYSRPLTRDRRLQWHVQGAIGVNRHETLRKIEIGGVGYHNKGDFYSAIGEIENKLRYEMKSLGGRVKAGLYASFDAGVGKIKTFTEKGDGIELGFKEKDLTIARPGAGADITLNKYTKGGKLSLTGKVDYFHELGKIYDGPNEMKIAASNADYYALELPEQSKNQVKLTAQIKYESKGGTSVGLQVTRTEGGIDSTRYGMNFAVKI